MVKPSKALEKSLRANRNSIIDTRCVFSESEVLVDFNEVEYGELSYIASHQNLDGGQSTEKNLSFIKSKP